MKASLGMAMRFDAEILPENISLNRLSNIPVYINFALLQNAVLFSTSFMNRLTGHGKANAEATAE